MFEPGKAVFYVDPPYYQARPALYQFSFVQEDHARLARLLRTETRPWLLSYDDHPGAGPASRASVLATRSTGEGGRPSC